MTCSKCSDPVKARGLCNKHYLKWQRNLEPWSQFSIEDEIPREQCHVRGCESQARYEWAGAFGTRWLCSRHRPLYRTHDLILRRIREA